jgi:glutaredoxin
MWKRIFTSLLLLSITAQTPAEIYKWVDAQGNVHFGDRAPKSAVTETIDLKINTFQSVTIEPFEPFESSPSRRSGRVVIYTTEWCGVCKKAKRYFQENKIAYQEYDVEKSEKGKKDYKAMNGSGVPIILVGKQRMNGFSQSRFDGLYKKR